MIYSANGKINLNSAVDVAHYSFNDRGMCRLFCIMMFYNYLSWRLYNILPFVRKMMAVAYEHKKYGDPEHDDITIEGLMRYYGLDNYSELLDFLAGTKKRSY
jgi:hypothetical protein